MRTLIVGCSFVEMFSLHCEINIKNTYQWDSVFGRINTDQFDIWGAAGSGNQAIAARVLDRITQEQYKKVIVLWSGVNRLDAPVSNDWHRAHNNSYGYTTTLGSTVFYHCGGLLGVYNTMPAPILEYFKAQIKGADCRFLTNNTLSAVISTQSILESNNIDYKMGWMYDPFADYTDTDIEPGCGSLDTTSNLFNLVNWDKINQTWAREWCLEHNMMYPDGFHWSWEGGREWFRQILNEDIFLLDDIRDIK